MSFSKKVKNRNILIVDDEPDVLHLLKLHLEAHRWQVTTASSPAEVFRELGRAPFFLIITDIAMPDLDGYELITRIKQKHFPSQIALTTGFGYNPKHTLIKINTDCKYPILFKPFEFKKSKLRDTIQHAWDEYHKGM